jgi:amidase
MTVGVLENGFGHESSEAVVDETVHTALDEFAEVGATVSAVSAPYHDDGVDIWHGVTTEALAALMRDEGAGHFLDGYYDTQFVEAMARAKRTRADDFPPTMKLILVLGEYLAEEYHGHYHAKAQNLRTDLRDSYDEALEDVDVLALPTTPHTPHSVKEDATRKEMLERAGTMLANTSPFNVSGHPAISVPCGTNSDGLPIGLMLVGSRFGDEQVLQAARAFEQSVAVDL